PPGPPPPPPPDSHPAPPSSAEPLAQRAPPPEIPASPRRILLVDDDPAVRRVVRALFGREGHTVEVARNTQQALELAATNTYDLIIADGRATARGRASSGGGGGRKLFVEELVARKAGLRDRILVATGDVQPATEEALGRLGLRYVRKPFNLRDLRDEAARVWAATTLS
ncbi:MAG TPA: response regulator, partial [Gemmatimonadales bacterium]|nr:response regulator [Gemmatimonadales bacterium]